MQHLHIKYTCAKPRGTHYFQQLKTRLKIQPTQPTETKSRINNISHRWCNNFFNNISHRWCNNFTKKTSFHNFI